MIKELKNILNESNKVEDNFYQDLYFQVNENNDQNEIQKHTESIKEKLSTDISQSFCFIKNNTIIGFYIFEKFDESYGNLYIHCIDTECLQDLFNHLVSFLDKTPYILELSIFRNDLVIQDHLIEFGFIEKERQRMYLQTSHHEAVISVDTYHFEKITESNLDIVSKISQSAHFIRNHIEGYQNFGLYEKQFNMEKQL